MDKSSVTGKYWVLYFQPSPESGERISIGLALQEDGHKRIEYDPTFSKVHKLYPHADLDGLEFFLQSVAKDFASASDPEYLLLSYGPQIGASNVRRVATPITHQTLSLLMEKCILPQRLAAKPAPAVERLDLVAKEIEAFVKNASQVPLEIRRDVKARDIFGRAVTGTKSIALAIPKAAGGWTLVDGVDLNKLSPSQAIKRADDIARTFWSYQRAEHLPPITRVGIVLNGTSHLQTNTLEAHDFALHRFRTDSDLAIDAASTEARGQMRKLLENSG